MGRFGRSSKLWGPGGVVLAVVAGAALPIILTSAGPAASLAAQSPVATCSPPSTTPPTTIGIAKAPVGTVVPVTTTTTTGVTVPPLCTPSLTANPSAELADGQTITVTGSGFTPNSLIGMAECESNATSPANCDLSTVQEVESDGTGSFSTPYTVSRLFTVYNDATGTSTTIDCALTPCLLGAADVSDYSVDAAAAIGFNPNLPLQLTGTVSTTGKVNTKTGVAYISGTVVCLQPTEVEVDVDLAQIYHRRFNFTSEGYTDVNCQARKKGTKWTVEVPPDLGLFGVGKATVQAELSAQIGNSYRDIDVPGNVVLQAKT
jgi:hypothetical protein